MSSKILLCSDLDGTVMPNGPQPEAPEARPLLRLLARHPEVRLAYVTGRHRELLAEAVREYDLPQPDFALTDVGSTVYRVNNGVWRPSAAWQAEIAPDWHGKSAAELAGMLDGFFGLVLQEPEKQNRFKLSYYISDIDKAGHLAKTVADRLAIQGFAVNVIWSVDPMGKNGLLDILPRSANKLHAIQFLMEREGFSQEKTVFAGDSGNDLAVLASGVQAVLVANAGQEVRLEAEHLASKGGWSARLYLAKGGFLGMNGNYAAGVLEGVAHFIPELGEWLTARAKK